MKQVTVMSMHMSDTPTFTVFITQAESAFIERPDIEFHIFTRSQMKIILVCEFLSALVNSACPFHIYGLKHENV